MSFKLSLPFLNLYTFFWMLLLPSFAFSQTAFSNAIVKLQDGGDIPLLELPWFKNQATIWSGKHSTHSNDYFQIFSSPNTCPSAMSFSYAFAHERGGVKEPRDLLKNDKSFGEAATLKQCDDYLNKQINDLSDEIKKRCKCKKILQTVKHASDHKQDSIWESLDDDIIYNHEVKFRFNLYSGVEKLPIIFSLGANSSGIFDISGNKLCEYNIPAKLEYNSSYIKKITQKPYAVSCVNNMQGKIDLSKLSFSFIAGELAGEVLLKFDNGESYVIKK